MKKRFIDERGRILGKVSVVDALMALLLIAVGVLIFARFSNWGTDTEDVPGDAPEGSVPVTFTVKVSQVRQGTVDALRVGDKIYNPNDGSELGVITDMEVKDAVARASDNRGHVVEMPVEGAFDVYLTIDGNAERESDGRLTIGILEIAVLSSSAFATKYVSTTGTIYTVEV